MPDDKATSQIPALTIRTVFIATHVMLLARRSVIRSYPIPTEDGGHRGGGASDKHRLSFCRTHVGKLGKKRPLGSAGHFDRTKQVRPKQFPGGSARWPEAASDIKVEGLDGKLFLARANGDAIFHLYPVAGAVSRLLAEPLGKAEAAKLIHAAFSDADRRRVRRNIRILFED